MQRIYTKTINPIFGETESIDRKDEAVDNKSHQTTQARQKTRVHSQSPPGESSSETSSTGYIFEPEKAKKRKPIQAEQGKLFKKDIYENYRVLLKTDQIALTNTFNGSAYKSCTRNTRHFSKWLYASTLQYAVFR